MKFASAQTFPLEENIEANIAEHLKWIQIASENNAGLIVFPEMSITGYMRGKAANFALAPDDKRLIPLKESAQKKNLVVIAGAPIKLNKLLFIGSFIFNPNGQNSIYTKQHLHPGEELFFNYSFNFNPLVTACNEQISLAICADIDHPAHAEKATLAGSSVYLPSIFFSKNGISDAYHKLSNYAKDYSLNILMSNFCGECWGTVSGGKSAFWSCNGELVASLDECNPGLLLVEKYNNSWHGETLQ